MRPILIAAMVSLLVTLGGTPFAIRYFRGRGYGQLIRENVGEIPAHAEKRGTPTAGGAMILLGIVGGYIVSHVASVFSRSGVLILGVMVGLGVIGFIDDYVKFHHQRSLGINKKAKVAGQAVVSIAFAVLAVHWAHVSTHLSFVRDSTLNLGAVGFVVWVFLIMAASSNGVNLTDGLDGLAAGSSALVFAAYVVISFWQFRHPEFYLVRNPLDTAIVAAAGLGACAGFLWWNAAPARIFMGDTGSLALGGGIAALAVMTSTQLLLVVLGGLFVLETTSVILQIIGYHGLRRRVFKMAPIHHHFELQGWPEFTVIVRFWIIAGLAAALGLGLFYADFLARGGIG
jgi:phospho-N-acetylmuramoyl-pentapeptide-transferase